MTLVYFLIGLFASSSVAKEETLSPKCGVPSNPRDGTWTLGGDGCGSGFKEKMKNGHLSLCPSEAINGCTMKSGFYEVKESTNIYLDIEIETIACKYRQDTKECRLYNELKVYTAESCDDGKHVLKSIVHLPEKQAGNFNTRFEEKTVAVTINNLTNVRGLVFVLHANRFCGTIKRFRAYYQSCEVKEQRLEVFNKQPAPSTSVARRIITGTCVEGAGYLEQPVMECFTNGTTRIKEGTCVCKPGYEYRRHSCTKCHDGWFKTTSGNHGCEKCGQNTKSPSSRHKCVCLSGYFRALMNRDMDTQACFAPPRKVKNIVVLAKTSSSVMLGWEEGDMRTIGDGEFIVEIIGGKEVKTKSTNVTLHDLGAYANYTVSIYKKNSVVDLVGVRNRVSFSFMTSPGAPGPVKDMEQELGTDGSITLSWSPPQAFGSNDLRYEIQFESRRFTIRETKYKFDPAGYTSKAFAVKITAVSYQNGKILRKGKTVEERIELKGGVPVGVALGATFAGMALVGVLLLLVFYLWRKRQPAHLNFSRTESGKVEMQHRRLGGKIYVDPTTYSDLDQAVYDFAYELDPREIVLGKMIGGGEYGEVFLGCLKHSANTENVAVKILRSGSGKRERDDFLSEAAILGQFNDVNVIGLKGVVTSQHPNMIVLEFMPHGALDKFLQQHDLEFSIVQLLGMARGVCSGMRYLSELGYIHRDLAARNILVDENQNCKVADFGMSRFLTDDTYDTTGGKIPIRWTAPEAIQLKKFTTASDVWSFGILLWEIMSYGERPYWDWSNYEVMERISSNYRLPPPMHCPKAVHDMMLMCWCKDRTKRPVFSAVCQLIEELIKNPKLLFETVSTITKSDENLDYSVMNTIGNWLTAIKMEQYTQLFIDVGLITPNKVLHLDLESLLDLGIEPIGHRKKIYKAIKNTRAQLECEKTALEASTSFGSSLVRKISFLNPMSPLKRNHEESKRESNFYIEEKENEIMEE